MKPLTPTINSTFDDALPERLITVPESHGRVQLQHGAGVPSPYIVKLREGQVAIDNDVDDEVFKLAQSLIIDADDDVSIAPLGDDGLSLALLDVRDQLREFDAVVPDAVFVTRASRPVKRAPAPVSLDEALARFVDGAFVAEDIIIAPEVPNSVAMPVEPIARTAASPWVHAEGAAQAVRVTRTGWFYHPTLRACAAFVGFSFALVLPLRAMQTISSTGASAEALNAIGASAIDDLERGASALRERRFDLAQDDFGRAAEKFSNAEAQLGNLQAAVVAVVSVIPETDRTYASVRGLITAGRELSQTASIMSNAAQDIAGTTSIDLVTKLELFASYVDNALPHAEAAAAALDRVDPEVIPDEYALRVAELRAQAPAVAASMREFLTLIDVFAAMLGGDEKMRYLAVFQNPTELRPTGGFIGSFAEMDIMNGEVVALRVPDGGSYAAQGQLRAFVAAPKPLQIVNARWEFQDANWFPDFPSTAKKMQWFYKQSGGPSTDGVIAINADVVVDLLALLGSVDMPAYGLTIDAENFMFEAQRIVEYDYDKTQNAPKAFIGDLAPILLDRIADADLPTFLAVLGVFETSLHERDVQVYAADNDLQAAVRELGWSGEIKHTDGDYLMIVDTNVGGGKTDGVIDETVDVAVHVEEDGGIVNTVTVSRTHQGLSNALFSGKNNVDYLRLYVPEGSVLLAADGFSPPPAEAFETSDVALAEDEDLAFTMSGMTVDQASGVDVWQEFGKTVFGQWVQTGPGETSIVTFTYRLPIRLFAGDGEDSMFATAKRELGFGRGDSYSLFVQKQAGVARRTTTVSLSLPDDWSAPWSTLGDAAKRAATENATDAFFGWLVTR